MEKSFYTYILTISGTILCGSSFFVWLSYAFYLKDFFTFSCRAGVLTLNYLIFCLSEKPLFCLHFWKIFLLTRILGHEVFFLFLSSPFQWLRGATPLSSGLQVVWWIFFPPSEGDVFFLPAVFQISSLTLVFSN